MVYNILSKLLLKEMTIMLKRQTLFVSTHSIPCHEVCETTFGLLPLFTGLSGIYFK